VELILKALLGAAIVVAIDLASRSKQFYLAGLVPLFPFFTLIAHYFVGSRRSERDLQETVLFSMLGLLPLFLYMVVVYFASRRVELPLALLAGAAAWFAAAGVLLLLWRRARG